MDLTKKVLLIFCGALLAFGASPVNAAPNSFNFNGQWHFSKKFSPSEVPVCFGRKSNSDGTEIYIFRDSLSFFIYLLLSEPILETDVKFPVFLNASGNSMRFEATATSSYSAVITTLPENIFVHMDNLSFSSDLLNFNVLRTSEAVNVLNSCISDIENFTYDNSQYHPTEEESRYDESSENNLNDLEPASGIGKFDSARTDSQQSSAPAINHEGSTNHLETGTAGRVTKNTLSESEKILMISAFSEPSIVVSKVSTDSDILEKFGYKKEKDSKAANVPIRKTEITESISSAASNKKIHLEVINNAADVPLYDASSSVAGTEDFTEEFQTNIKKHSDTAESHRENVQVDTESPTDENPEIISEHENKQTIEAEKVLDFTSYSKVKNEDMAFIKNQFTSNDNKDIALPESTNTNKTLDEELKGIRMAKEKASNENVNVNDSENPLIQSLVKKLDLLEREKEELRKRAFSCQNNNFSSIKQ